MEVHELAKQVQAFHEEMRGDMAVLKRGMYGDKDNRVKGLLERQDADEKRMDDIEDDLSKTKQKLWRFNVLIGFIMVGLGAGWEFIKTVFK
jgi:hypothetical protein